MSHVIPIQDPIKQNELAPEMDGGVRDLLTLCNITIGDPQEVDRYLANHADLASILLDVCSRLRTAFGSGVELALEVYHDPEQQDEYLALYVRQDKYQTGLLSQIEDVSGPFMAQLECASGHFLITTDFRLPRG